MQFYATLGRESFRPPKKEKRKRIRNRALSDFGRRGVHLEGGWGGPGPSRAGAGVQRLPRPADPAAEVTRWARPRWG